MADTTIASLLASAERGDPGAAQELFAALYAELHRIARRELGHGNQLTLGVTTLLHEAYLRISSQESVVFPDRARFMAYAARVMRRLVIDHVRNRRAIKRGGQFEITALDTTVPDPHADDQQLERLSDALDELAAVDAALAEVVDLKFFCGFSFGEIAVMHGVSERTTQRQWEKARIYLHRALGAEAALA